MLSQAADVAWGRKATAGDSWLHPPGPGGQRSTACCPRQAWPSLLSPHTNYACLCWKRALKWRNLTCHLLASGSYRVPKVLSAWQSPMPKRWAHLPSLPFPPPLQSSQNQAGGTWGWSWGGPGEEGGSALQSALPSTPRSSKSLAPSSQAQSSFPFNIRDAVCLARGFTWSLICTTLCNTCTNIHTHSLFHISGVQGHLLIPCLWQSRPPGPEERGALGRWGRSRQSLYRCWAHFSGEVVNPS